MTSYSPEPETFRELAETRNSTNYVEVIQTVIASLQEQQSAMVSKTEDGYVWKFRYGSVEVFVQLSGQQDTDTFTVWANVLQLPAKDEARLMRQLLEMNWYATFESRFAIFNNQVIVSSSNTIADLTPGEISRIITVVATIADENDEALQAEFGAA